LYPETPKARGVTGITAKAKAGEEPKQASKEVAKKTEKKTEETIKVKSEVQSTAISHVQ